MNYYEILDISEKATQKEIKKSYKSLIKKYHPDIYEGDKSVAENKTKEINEAYEILSNPSSRQDYDDMLSSNFENDTIDININDDISQYNYDEHQNNYDSYYKYNNYTTNYYGVSRDDLKKEKKKYENDRTSDYYFFNISKNKFIILMALGLITIICILIFLLSSLKSMLSGNYINVIQNEVPQNVIDDEIHDIPYIYFGIPFSKVKALLGTPDFIENIDNKVYAYYGNSYIVFDEDNIVVDWKNDGDFYTDTKTGIEAQKLYNYINSYINY